jgi:signal transduction histidine kinase
MMSYIQRAGRELWYGALGSVVGVFGIYTVGFTLVAGLGLTVTVFLTVIGVLLVTVSLRLASWLGRVHRWLLARLIREEVPAPPRFEPGKGILNRVDLRLRYRHGWRAVAFTVLKAPVALIQAFAVSNAVCGLIDITYPVAWPLFRNHPSGTHLSPLIVVQPQGIFEYHISTWPETFLAALLGLAWALAGVLLAKGSIALDRRLIRSLLGPGTLTERVTELERTRALAVDDSAAALRRVERDLHDGAQMRLAALAMNLGMAQEKLGAEGELTDAVTARELIAAAHRNAVDALADLRDIARGIHPPVLDNGLAAALESLAASSAIPATVIAGTEFRDLDPAQRPSPAIETIAYFCAAELMANATKHSYANQIKIEITSERRGVLRLRITDDGIGGADGSRGSGLTGLVQRVSTVDGRLELSSPPGGPTVAVVDLPLRASGDSNKPGDR